MRWEAASNEQRGTVKCERISLSTQSLQNLTVDTNQPGCAPSTNARGKGQVAKCSQKPGMAETGIFFPPTMNEVLLLEN